ncbi:MAG TPA: GNAT family N-acetyltransferase [Candidatus Limnocylindria bacterium]|nr:GNAT family N-acetyltransferase [Candidatus Limnocylindria bacterium]
MSLGNPERPVGGLAVRAPAGVELRPLGRDDLTEAVALARDGHGARSIDDLDGLRPRFEALLSSSDVTPFVAESGGAAAGIAILHFRRRLNFTSFEGWISELFVRPVARGHGIGRALLDALVAEWRLRGGHRLQIQVPDQAAAAEALLARAGLEAWMLDFEQRPVASPVRVEPPPGVTLRSAHDGDGEVVTSLLSEFGAPRTPPPERMDAVLRTFDDHLRRVEKGEARLIVAEQDGVAVGACSLEWRAPFWTEEIHAWLPDLVVTESARGRGIGSALLADAMGAAAKRGATQLSLESGRTRTAAHHLYRSRGFRETGQTYRLLRAEW